MSIKYYFVVGSKQFLCDEEPLEEILRERLQSLNAKSNMLVIPGGFNGEPPVNFWILENPKFLEASEFQSLKGKLPNNPIAIISTSKTFITWLKLRLNHVYTGNFSQTNISPLDF